MNKQASFKTKVKCFLDGHNLKISEAINPRKAKVKCSICGKEFEACIHNQDNLQRVTLKKQS